MTTTTSLSERIADGIVDLIHADGLGPGDALESSRDLAKRFEVTTPTIREALRRLEATDIIRFRHGSGTYVGDGIARRLIANPHLGGGTAQSALELVEARLVLEPAVAAAAARARTAESLATLAATTEHALQPQVGRQRPTVTFHAALAGATGNPLVREMVEALLAVRARDQVEIRHRYDDRERDHAEHVAIVEAVRAGDAAAAERLTREHLTSIRDALATQAARAARPRAAHEPAR